MYTKKTKYATIFEKVGEKIEKLTVTKVNLLCLYFSTKIKNNTSSCPDEPENSLSPGFQLKPAEMPEHMLNFLKSTGSCFCRERANQK